MLQTDVSITLLDRPSDQPTNLCLLGDVHPNDLPYPFFSQSFLTKLERPTSIEQPVRNFIDPLYPIYLLGTRELII
jgi:hypothetical protein